jgi:hypothetical protein
MAMLASPLLQGSILQECGLDPPVGRKKKAKAEPELAAATTAAVAPGAAEMIRAAETPFKDRCSAVSRPLHNTISCPKSVANFRAWHCPKRMFFPAG